VGNFIFTENVLTYDTFLNLLDESQRMSRKQSLENLFGETNTQDLNEEILDVSKSQSGFLQAKSVEANPNYIDSLLLLTDNQSITSPYDLPFIVQIERINEILLRVITGKVDGQHPAFDFKKMMMHMTDMGKYTAFKKLVSQTAHVLKIRTSQYPSLLRKINKHTSHEQGILPNQISLDDQEGNNSGVSQKGESKDEYFNEGLRIIMYDKIIKSGFNHLSIFLDDFNYIYNEVITSTNNNLGDAQLKNEAMDLQAGQLMFDDFPKPSVQNQKQEFQSESNVS
jgi:hypothetical protein